MVEISPVPTVRAHHAFRMVFQHCGARNGYALAKLGGSSDRNLRLGDIFLHPCKKVGSAEENGCTDTFEKSETRNDTVCLCAFQNFSTSSLVIDDFL